MAYSDHDNWYQSRLIRGGRRHAGDRENQNLYSDGVREFKNNSIRGPLTAETRQDLQNDFNRVISLMEGLITRINNNIAHQAQFAKQSQEKYLESKKKFDARFDAILNRISTKALKTTPHEKEAVDLENNDEVIEKEAEHEDLNDTEDAVSLDVNREGGQNAFPVRSDNQDRMSIGKSNRRPEYPEKRYDSMKAAHSIEMEYLGFCNKRTKKRRAKMRARHRRCAVQSGDMEHLGFWKKKNGRKRGSVRRQRRRTTKKVPVVFPVVGDGAGGFQCRGGRGVQAAGSGVAVDVSRKCISDFVRAVRVDGIGTNNLVVSQIEEEGKYTGRSFWKTLGIRVGGKAVIGPIYDITGDVIHSILSLILILDAKLYYNLFHNCPAYISLSTISQGLLIILRVLARITFYPP